MARYFRTKNHSLTPAHEQISARYELIITCLSLVAALAFVIGSILFLDPDHVRAGTWFFVFGSAFFALAPLLKLYLEYKLMQLPKGASDVD